MAAAAAGRFTSWAPGAVLRGAAGAAAMGCGAGADTVGATVVAGTGAATDCHSATQEEAAGGFVRVAALTKSTKPYQTAAGAAPISAVENVTPVDALHAFRSGTCNGIPSATA